MSNPPTIKSCLNNCGDCGKAKNSPFESLAGTKKSLAPSGVDFVSNGVSTSVNPELSRYSLTALIILCLVFKFLSSFPLLRSKYLYFSLSSSFVFS